MAGAPVGAGRRLARLALLWSLALVSAAFGPGFQSIAVLTVMNWLLVLLALALS